MTETLEIRIKSARATLKFLRRDLFQIYNVSSAISKGDDSLIKDFQAMYPSASSIRDQYLNEFKAYQVLAITENKDNLFPTEEDIKARGEINSIYYKIVEFHQSLNVTSSVVSLETSIINQTLNRTRLPQISLPTFSGTISEWPKYKELYESMVHNNSDVPTIEKYYHLNQSLSGDPKTLISTYSTYSQAWHALVQRYDNQRLLAASYVEKIINYAPLKGHPNLASYQNFIRVIVENVKAIKKITINNEADFLWLTLALSKLDQETRRKFETFCVNKEWPTYNDLVEFIQGNCRILQLSGPSSEENSKSPKVIKSTSKYPVLTTTSLPQSFLKNNTCSCLQKHHLYECPSFRERDLSSRKTFLKGKNVCFNCLKAGHFVSGCTSTGRCRTCRGKHHTLLHDPKVSSPALAPSSSQTSDKKSSADCTENVVSPDTPQPVVASVTGPAHVLLGTAEVLIPNSEGLLQPVRLLLDCGSQFSLITSACARRLGLEWRATRHTPLGAGQTPLPQVKGRLQCELHSRLSPCRRLLVEPLVVASITGDLPTAPIPRNVAEKYLSHMLADPLFWKPRPIDFLLGNDLFMQCLTDHPRSSDGDYGTLSTIFGLILMGASSSSSNTPESRTHCLCLAESPLSPELITRFWEMEEIPSQSINEETDACEDHFLKTHYRDPSGRYVVSLPFKEDPGDLSGSVHLSNSRFRNLELKFIKNPELKEKYSHFLNEYEELGHMAEAKEPSKYVIPHHAVFKSTDPDAKIRVVFDASMQTRNGSLNDKLYTGRKLQRDITDVILNFRRYRYALTGDLVKMYRQILINPKDRCYQHIIWRTSDGKLKRFALNTVTYGTNSAPFLAIRTLRQLVKDEGSSFPRAVAAILDECYVDDIMSGGDTLQDVLSLQAELSTFLSKGGFQIHKWCSNNKDYKEQESINNTHNTISLTPSDTCVRKVLGMCWDPVSDALYFNVTAVSGNTTKRGILSVIARLFDPLGLLSPVVFKAKCMLQDVWSAKCDWDEEVPPALAEEWLSFSQQLPILSQVRIPRHVFPSALKSSHILAFSDASQRGTSAVAYLRTVSDSGHVQVSLLKSKTRLAPLKTLSIPRLELSAAHLLVKLIESIKPFINSIGAPSITYFSDSMIVLAWLKISPHKLQTFVATRVSYITTHSSPENWYHVASEDNPADVASRGLFPEQLAHCSIWWSASSRFSETSFLVPSPELPQEVPELKSGVSLVINRQENWLLSFISTHSQYHKMLRILAYIMRYIEKRQSIPLDQRKRGELTPAEVNRALFTCIREIQRHGFAEEFSWETGEPLSRRLLTLAAFRDDHGLIRVGGRLQNSQLPFETKFPILLPGDTHLVKIMIDHYHKVHYHLGAKALQSHIRRTFWLFRARQTIRSRINKCLICVKLKSRPCPPFMGNLPGARVRASPAFTITGVDYAGPFTIKTSMRRNSPTTKAYLALFICFSTKAIHLECVSSLSTEAFLAAFDRFVSRRGLPNTVYSDCGTNFVGAARTLRDLYLWLRDSENQGDICRYATHRGVQWKFMPPYSPHFGGLWEAGVKSAKQHLNRVIGGTPLLFEELNTIFSKVEAILNSRPLCPLNNDTTHGDFLTPGHFLIGAPLIAPPELDVTHLKLNQLSRWQLVKHSTQHFWKRWHCEYLNTLQQRQRWFCRTKNISEEDLVLISDPATPPLSWPTARVVECHPGQDGVTRVVSLQTPKGIIKRSVHKLIVLSHLSDTKF